MRPRLFSYYKHKNIWALSLIYFYACNKASEVNLTCFPSLVNEKKSL